MVGDVDASGGLHGGEVTVAQQLLVRGHPVSESDVQERCELEFGKHII